MNSVLSFNTFTDARNVQFSRVNSYQCSCNCKMQLRYGNKNGVGIYWYWGYLLAQSHTSSTKFVSSRFIPAPSGPTESRKIRRSIRRIQSYHTLMKIYKVSVFILYFVNLKMDLQKESRSVNFMMTFVRKRPSSVWHQHETNVFEFICCSREPKRWR